MSERPLIIGPQPGPQTLGMACEADIAILGGGMGGGKSYYSILDATRWHHVPGYKAIIFREFKEDITSADGLWDTSYEICPHLRGKPRVAELDWRWFAGEEVIELGSRLEFGHMRRYDDFRRYIGPSYAFIGFDELNLIAGGDERVFWKMLTRNRSTCGVRPYVRATCNPDPDSWVKDLVEWYLDEEGYPIPELSGVLRYFIRDGDERIWGDSPDELIDAYPKLTKRAPPLSFTFIPATIDDNPKLLEKDPGYISRMTHGLDAAECACLLGGNWRVRPDSGKYFKDAWWGYVDEPPKKVIARARSWDLAASEAKSETDETTAWTRGVLMSLTAEGVITIEHEVGVRGTPGTVDELVKTTANADGRGITQCFWQDPGSAGKREGIYMRGLLVGHSVEVEVASKDKERYAAPLSSQCQGGKVFIVRGHWNREFVAEHRRFPDAAIKDRVDATSRGTMALTEPSCLAKLKALAGLNLGGAR